MKYIMLWVCVGFLALGWVIYFQHQTIISERSRNTNLQQNYQVLWQEVKKREKDNAEVEKRSQEFQQTAETEKTKGGFNWFNRLPNDNIVMRLRQ